MKFSFNLLVLIVLMILGLYILYDWGIEELTQEWEAQNHFCKESGYEKAIEYHTSHPIFRYDEAIECEDTNGEKDIFQVYHEIICIKFNKWGECSEEDIIFK